MFQSVLGGAVVDATLICDPVPFPGKFVASAMTEGRQTSFDRISGLLASSFTFDSHERHKSLFLAKSRKSACQIWQPSYFTQKQGWGT